MPNPTVVTDVEDRFRTLNDAERRLAGSLLADAWEELLAPRNVPDLEDRLGRDVVSVGLVRRVVAAMVIRVLRNPEAIRQWQVDDASFTRDSMVSSGLLYASADEIALLSGPTTAAFTIRPGWRR
ncbi:hypothetical protein [Blastococcus xanthinilyticus]|uniref:Head-to-tail adaptor n=1 Tax=Blastococcus xanthinilyticus TaxID=1564164 RepID=A0A5S5CQA9_9ACTN|nr:hypothetical protein [Blastococcus xanthinilyticus]TYP82069.1 hypothetical protein BD833_12053 [Blastococcus xanthinilyticus]